MQIKLKCSCGATFEANSSTFINGGGAEDSQGRRYLVEVRADEWTERHRAHLRSCTHTFGPKYDTEVGPAHNCTKCGALLYV